MEFVVPSPNDQRYAYDGVPPETVDWNWTDAGKFPQPFGQDSSVSVAATVKGGVMGARLSPRRGKPIGTLGKDETETVRHVAVTARRSKTPHAAGVLATDRDVGTIR